MSKVIRVNSDAYKKLKKIEDKTGIPISEIASMAISDFVNNRVEFVNERTVTKYDLLIK